MKDRIAHILKIKNLTATRFADDLNVQRSGISHILSGRNNPSLDFIIKIKETYPEFSLDWLLLGKGPVTLSPVAEKSQEKELSLFIDEEDDKHKEVVQPKEGLFSQARERSSDGAVPLSKEANDQKKTTPTKDEVVAKDIESKDVAKIVVLFTNNTFQSYDPA